MKLDPIARKELLESDRRYFELNARKEQVGPFQLSWLSGLEDLPAGAVCHQVVREEAMGDSAEIEKSLQEIEDRFLEFQNPMVRIYSGNCHSLTQVLSRRGYQCREEVVFARTERARSDHGSVRLRPVREEGEWRQKLSLHAESDSFVDGHSYSPASWVALEKARAETGRVKFYLIEQDGKLHGTVGLMRIGSVLRIKNIFLRPDSRGQGLGASMLARIFDRIDGSDTRAVGVVALRREPVGGFYRASGMKEIGMLVEWTRKVN